MRLQVADLFLRLKATKPPPDGKSAIAAGLSMVDPSEWSPGMKSEHPWSDADEFFASAKEAYQMNPDGLRSSIARAARADPAIGPLGRELLALLAAVYGRGSMPKGALPKDRAADDAAALSGLDRVSNIEDSVAITRCSTGSSTQRHGRVLTDDNERHARGWYQRANCRAISN